MSEIKKIDKNDGLGFFWKKKIIRKSDDKAVLCWQKANRKIRYIWYRLLLFHFEWKRSFYSEKAQKLNFCILSEKHWLFLRQSVLFFRLCIVKLKLGLYEIKGGRKNMQITKWSCQYMNIFMKWRSCIINMPFDIERY